MKERDRGRQKGNLKAIPPKNHRLANVARVVMATGFIAIPAWAACGRSEDTLPEPTPIATTGTPIPKDTPTLVFGTPTPIMSTPSTGEIPESTAKPRLPEPVYEVAIDNDSLPVSFILPDGKKFSFEKGKMQQLRKTAIQNKEPEIITIIPSTIVPYRSERMSEKIMRDFRFFRFEFTPVPKDSSKHPTLSELPEDVLSEEELTGKGVKIIQADNTSLHIRKTAFEEGSLLSDFNNTGKELTIVLVDGPTVSKIFMDNPKYDGVRHLIGDGENLQDWIQSIMPREINFTRQVIDIKRKQIQSLANLGRDMSDQEEQTAKEAIEEAIDDMLVFKAEDMLILKALVYAFDNNMFTNEELLRYALSQFGPKSLNTQDNEGNSIIFLTVGDIDLSPFNRYVLFFNRKGHFTIQPELVTPPLLGIYPSASSSPQAGQSHPDPADLSGVSTPLFTPRPPHNPPGVSLRVGLSGDVAGARQVKEPWDRWVNSGYTDNRGYYFVFSLPEGGYILTKHEPSDPTTSAIETT